MAASRGGAISSVSNVKIVGNLSLGTFMGEVSVVLYRGLTVLVITFMLTLYRLV